MDYTDWLGHITDELTDEQREAFNRAADAYYRLPFHADRDAEDVTANALEDGHALTAILQSVLGESTLRTAADRVQRAREVLNGWVRASAALGVSEVQIAERSRLSRPTVRKRLGK